VQRSDHSIILIISQNGQGRLDMFQVTKWNLRCSRVTGQHTYKLQVSFPEFLWLIVTKKYIFNVET
jgi:hypothetical protein